MATRDIGAPGSRCSAREVTVRRIALNMDQVDQYRLPPNPAKLTDARATSYISRYGNESLEPDALDPTILDALITATIDDYRDPDQWDTDTERRWTPTATC